MGTRSITRVFEDEEQLVNMYRQMDGYPTGHGKDLYDFLKDVIKVNGLGGKQDGRVCNGAGCFAAQLVAEFKDGPGSIYLVRGEPGVHGQEYEYQIHYPFETCEPIKVIVRNYPKKKLFEGTVEEFGVWLEHEGKAEG